MFTWMRTHQRWLMLLITILVIVSFIWLFNAQQIDTIATGSVAKVYGKSLTVTDIQKEAGMMRLALMLGLSEYASTLEGTNVSDDGSVDFVINNMILRHEGRELGIVPSDKQVEQAIMKLPVFQTNGKFDGAKYQTFIEQALAPRGFVPKHVDQIVRDSIILDEVTKIIDAVPTATAAEVDTLNRAFEPATGAAIVFNRSDYTGKAQVTDEDINASYTLQEETLVTPEWRSAQYVKFSMPADAAKLEGPARIEAQQKIADQAAEFADKAATEGFNQAATNLGYKAELTLPFDRQGNIKNAPGITSNLDSLSGPARAIAPTIFTLTDSSPVSGVIPDGQDFIVAKLEEVTAPQRLTLEEARPKLVEELTNVMAEKLLDDDATKVADQLKTAIKDGKSFADAATAAGLKTVPFTDVAPLGDNPDTALRSFADATTSLRENEISGFMPNQEGGFVVWLEKRSPATGEDANSRTEQITDYVVARKRSILLYEWLIWAREKAGVKFGES